MKKLLFLLLIFVRIVGGAQAQTHIAGKWSYDDIRVLQRLGIPTDTLSSAINGSIAIKGSILYGKIAGIWISLSSGGGGGGVWGAISGNINTQTDLINTLGLKLNKSDTAAMLAAYAKLAQVVKISDSAAMLAPYLRISSFTKSNIGLGNVSNNLQVINAGGATSWAVMTFATLPSPATGPTFVYASDSNAIYYTNASAYIKIAGGSGGTGSADSTTFVTKTFGGAHYYPLSGNPSAFLTGITNGQVLTAIGYTPYNATNPSGFISGNQTISYSPTGDVSGSASGTVTLAPATVVNKLKGVSIPSLSNGYFKSATTSFSFVNKDFTDSIRRKIDSISMYISGTGIVQYFDRAGLNAAKDFGYSISNTAHVNDSILNVALAYAVNKGQDLYLPGGNYQDSSFSLPANTGASKAIRIYGDANTIITSTQKSGILFSSINNSYDRVVIEKIQFINTHDTTNIGPVAILLQGVSPNFITNVKIKDCKFSGWLSSVLFKGVRGGIIDGNDFPKPNGHDGGTYTTVPNADIRLIDDTAGDLNRNIAIINNTAEGYSSTGDITTTKTKAPSDGFVYGHADGLYVFNNKTRRFGQEHYLIQPQISFNDTLSTIIFKNDLDCAIPKGSLDITSGLKLRAVYGIRADGRNTIIDGNNISNATIAIAHYLVGTWNYINRNLVIQNNTIGFSKDTASWVQAGAWIQGFSPSVRSIHPIMQNNTFTLDSVSFRSSFDFLVMANTDSGVLSGNNIYISRLIKHGFGTHFMTLSNVTNLQVPYNNQFADTFAVTSNATYQIIGGNSNITVVPSPTSVAINSSNGTPGTIFISDFLNAGAMGPKDRFQLDSLHKYNDSIRVFRKLGTDSVFIGVTPFSSGIELVTFQYMDSSSNAAAGITQLIGDVLTPLGSGVQAAVLAVVNNNTGIFGDNTHVPVFNVDNKGRILSVQNVAIAASGTNLGNTPTTNSVQISSNSGTPTTLAAATEAFAGVITAAIMKRIDSSVVLANVRNRAGTDTMAISKASLGTGLPDSVYWRALGIHVGNGLGIKDSSDIYALIKNLYLDTSASVAHALTQGMAAATYATLSNISGFINDPLTTRGDIFVGGVSGAPSRLAAGSSHTLLHANGAAADLTWGSIALATEVSGVLPVANGGTAAATLSGYVFGNGTSAMTASTTIPGSAISGNITGNAANITGQLSVGSLGSGTGASNSTFLRGDMTWVSVGGGSGTVTAFTAGNLSPLFTSSVATGTSTPALTFSLSNAAAHTFFGNFTGSVGGASYSNPSLTADFANQGTTTTLLHGNASGNMTWGQVSLASDVTGQLTEVHLGLSNNTTGDVNTSRHGLVPIAPNDGTKYLDGTGIFTTITTVGTVGTGIWQGTQIDGTHGGTGQTSYTVGDILYASSGSALSKLAGNTTAVKQFLTQQGNGSISATPIWGGVADNDVAFTNITTNNVSISKHGYAPILPNDAGQFLNGVGAWANPNILSTLTGTSAGTYTGSLGTAVPLGGGASFSFSLQNSISGQFNLNTGTGSGTAGGSIVTVTMPVAQPSANYKIFLQDVNDNMPGTTAKAIASDATHFVISCKTGVSLQASTSYQWNFLIVQ